MFNSQTARLIIIQAIMNAAGAIAGTFSLIFLVKEGFTYSESLIYLVVAVGTAALLCPILSFWGSMRPRYSIAAGSLFVGINYGLFLMLDGYALLILPGIFFGFYIVFFWIPYNALLLRQTSQKNRGFIIAFTFFIYPLIAIIMPVLGGSIIEQLDYFVVFSIAFGILIVTSVIALASRNLLRGKLRVGISIKCIGRSLSRALFFEGLLEGVHWFALPLLAYQFAGGEFKTGILFSMFALVGTFASLIIGKVSDRTKNRILWIKIGAAGAIPGLIIAGLSEPLDSIVIFIIGMAIYNFFIPLVWVFLMSHAGDVCGKRYGPAMLTREYMLNAGRALSAVASIYLLFHVGIGPVLALSSIFLLGVVTIRE